MNIEDRMSLWAAKRPREEPSELLLEGAQEIADLRRQREEDGKQMSALIDGYQKMQALCIDGKHLTDEERVAVGVAMQCVEAMRAQKHPEQEGERELLWGSLHTLRSLLERMK
jgi:hypothetical protein